MSHAERLERLRAGLDARGLDGFLVSQPESRFYLSGYAGHDLPPRDSAGYLLVTRDRALLLTDPRTTEQAEAEAPLYEVLTYPAGSRGPETIGQTAQKLGLAQLGFESVHLPYGIWQEISRHQPLVPTYDVVDELRIVKDAEELAELQAAVDVLDRCLAHVLAGLEPGLSERQVARSSRSSPATPGSCRSAWIRGSSAVARAEKSGIAPSVCLDQDGTGCGSREGLRRRVRDSGPRLKHSDAFECRSQPAE